MGAEFVRGRVCQGPSLLGAEMSRNRSCCVEIKLKPVDFLSFYVL